MALLTMFGASGFSVLYPDLYEGGLRSPQDAAELLFGLEDQGWLRVLTWAERKDQFRPATKRSRKDFLTAHENVKPRWDPDVDYGETNLHFDLTVEGKAEYLRREGETKDEDAWKGQLEDREVVVWATSEANTRRVARRLVRQSYVAPEGQRMAFRRHAVEPATFELKTEEQFNGVRVTYGLRLAKAGAN
ncbi:MAG: hypothetical protein AABM30_12070 [Actinomycetota bacterium]